MDPANLQAQKMRQAPAAPRRYDGSNGNPLYEPANGGHYGTYISLPSHAPAPGAQSVTFELPQERTLAN